MEQSIWIVLLDNDWMFGYLMNVPGVHLAGRSCVMDCRSQTSWEGFPLSWKWVSGETPLDILEMSHLHYMFGKQHEWDGIDYVGKTCVDMKCKKELGWLTEGLSTQRREPHSSLTKAYCVNKWISVMWPLLRICMFDCWIQYAEHVLI